MDFVLTRRHCLKLAAFAGLAAQPAVAAFRHFPQDGAWFFNAESQGKTIGEHRIGFSRSGNELIVRSDSAWELSERYTQYVEERWVDGWLRGLISDTRYGAQTWRVRAEWGQEALRGYRNGNAFSISGYSIAHTLWHPDSPHVRELLDPRDAKLKIISSFDLGSQEMLVDGNLRSAVGYNLYGAIRAALWYDAEGALLAATVSMPDAVSVDLRLARVVETRSG